MYFQVESLGADLAAREVRITGLEAQVKGAEAKLQEACADAAQKLSVALASAHAEFERSLALAAEASDARLAAVQSATEARLAAADLSLSDALSSARDAKEQHEACLAEVRAELAAVKSSLEAASATLCGLREANVDLEGRVESAKREMEAQREEHSGVVADRDQLLEQTSSLRVRGKDRIRRRMKCAYGLNVFPLLQRSILNNPHGPLLPGGAAGGKVSPQEKDRRGRHDEQHHTGGDSFYGCCRSSSFVFYLQILNSFHLLRWNLNIRLRRPSCSAARSSATTKASPRCSAGSRRSVRAGRMP